jgi:hypothetical protein
MRVVRTSFCDGRTDRRRRSDPYMSPLLRRGDTTRALCKTECVPILSLLDSREVIGTVANIFDNHIEQVCVKFQTIPFSSFEDTNLHVETKPKCGRDAGMNNIALRIVKLKTTTKY